MDVHFHKEKMDGNQYNINQLIDHNYLDKIFDENTDQSIVCDIDKTYLDTNYDSFFDLAKIPFEDAEDKVGVLGAKETLYAARWGHINHRDSKIDLNVKPRPLHFVSSSPPQLRKVIQKKFILDGLDWTSDTFKNQMYNLKKRRFSLLRQQVAYKSKAIIDIIIKNKAKEYYMIGDSGESDAYVYMGIKLLLDKKISPNGYKKYLEFSGVDKNGSSLIVNSLKNVSFESKIKGIFIRNIQGHELCTKNNLADPVFSYTYYLELVLVFMEIGLIHYSSLWQMIRMFHNKNNMSIYTIYEILRSFFSKENIKNHYLREEIESIMKILSSRVVNDNISFQIKVELPFLQGYEKLNEEKSLYYAKNWFQQISSNKKM